MTLARTCHTSDGVSTALDASWIRLRGAATRAQLAVSVARVGQPPAVAAKLEVRGQTLVHALVSLGALAGCASLVQPVGVELDAPQTLLRRACWAASQLARTWLRRAASLQHRARIRLAWTTVRLATTRLVQALPRALRIDGRQLALGGLS